MINIDIRKRTIAYEEYSIYVSFPYDADVVDIIRDQQVRFWNKDTKEWELPLSCLENLVDKLHNYEIMINADENVFEPKKVEIPSGFEYKTKPYKHQEDGVIYGIQHDKWLLGDEQGLGKTKEVIDLAVIKKLQKGYKHCLIICGVNGLKWNWVNEIETHSNEKAWIIGQRVNRKGKTVIDGNQNKYDDLVHLLREDDHPINDHYFIITNIESLRYKVDTGVTEIDKNGEEVKVYEYPIADVLFDLCNTNKIQMIAFDELHKCKNISSEQGKQLLGITTETMIGMSGTPLMNQPMDLYIILKWLGYETHSFYSFKNHYCEMGGYNDYEIIGYKNLDELQKKLDAIMLRRKKEDVLDLPEKIYVDEFVEMTPKQAQIYKEASNDIMTNIDKIKASNNPLSEMIRLRQATGYTGILSSTIMESAKLDRMKELVDDALENGRQVVIFSNWTQITNAVEKKLSGYSLGVITGDTKDEDRQTIKDNFQEGKSKIMIGTIGAMGTGLTLTAGSVEIFMDEPWNKANKEQAEDRCHRIGQNSNLTIYTLMCKNTIDERIHEIVEQKGMMADAIVDGKINMDKGQLVDFLLS